MPTNKNIIRAYVAQDEYERIKNQAKSAGLSLSTFIKRACLGEKIHSVVDHDALLALLHSKADLGRMGGLLKMYLSESAEGLVSRQEAKALLKNIEDGQKHLTREFLKVSQALLHKKNMTGPANLPGQKISANDAVSSVLATRPER